MECSFEQRILSEWNQSACWGEFRKKLLKNKVRSIISLNWTAFSIAYNTNVFFYPS